MTGKIERFCIKKSQAVISAGFKLSENASEIKRKDLYCIPNGAYYDNTISIKNINSTKELVYVGSLDKAFDLSGLIKAIATKSIPDIKLTLIGSGDDLQNLKIEVLDNNLEKKYHFFMAKLKGRRYHHCYKDLG